MHRRNCATEKIGVVCQPFKLAVFLNVSFLSLSSLHFRSFVLQTHPLSVYIRHLSLYCFCRPDTLSHRQGELSRYNHESWPCGCLVICPCGYARVQVLMVVAIADSTANTLYILSNEAQSISFEAIYLTHGLALKSHLSINMNYLPHDVQVF